MATVQVDPYVPYVAEISRRQPLAIVFVVDTSASMGSSWGVDGSRTLAAAASSLLNRALTHAVIVCAKAEGVGDYIHASVICHGDGVVDGFGGQEPSLKPISWIADHPVRVEEVGQEVDDGAGATTTMPVNIPIWFDPSAAGDTEPAYALDAARELVLRWVVEHEDAFPPIVCMYTDGASFGTAGADAAAAIHSHATSDGQTLVAACHLSGSHQRSMLFPGDVDSVPDPHARQLFAATSPLPEALAQDLSLIGVDPVTPGARCYGFQTDPGTALFRALALRDRPVFGPPL